MEKPDTAMSIIYPNRSDLPRVLAEQPDDSLDFIVLVTGAFHPLDVPTIEKYLDESIRALRDVEVFFETFPTWGKALKAAKLEARL